MNLERLEYIKNISDLEGRWAYSQYRKGSYFPLNFRKGEGAETNALKLPQYSMVILSQNFQGTRYLSHLVEVVNDIAEDQRQWQQSEWGIIRWVKVHWAADHTSLDNAPRDEDVMQVNWGWYNTQAKSLHGTNLMTRWKSIEALRSHLRTVFI